MRRYAAFVRSTDNENGDIDQTIGLRTPRMGWPVAADVTRPDRGWQTEAGRPGIGMPTAECNAGLRGTAMTVAQLWCNWRTVSLELSRSHYGGLKFTIGRTGGGNRWRRWVSAVEYGRWRLTGAQGLEEQGPARKRRIGGERAQVLEKRLRLPTALRASRHDASTRSATGVWRRR